MPEGLYLGAPPLSAITSTMSAPVLLRSFSAVFARLALGTVFLSVVADRFGLWGPPGAPSVAWGAFGPFLENVRLLNPFLPESLVAPVGWMVTAAELTLGVLLLLGWRTRWVALGSGGLLLIFAVSTAVAFGLKVPLNYSIFSASAGAFLLAGLPFYPASLDAFLSRRSTTAPPTAA